MNRRSLLKALLALPVAAAAAPLSALAPKPFADCGFVSEKSPGDLVVNVCGHSCTLPVTMRQVPSRQVGTINVEIRCDTSKLEADLERIKKTISRDIWRKRLQSISLVSPKLQS
jgi:hypothetical protein